MMIDYQELIKHFLFGGPVYYHNQRCNVVNKDDKTQTVTLREAYTGRELHGVKPEQLRRTMKIKMEKNNEH